MHHWAARPLSATALGLLIICTIWHARLGMQIMLEDYVHENGNKFACTAFLNFAACAGIVFGLISVIRIALGGA